MNEVNEQEEEEILDQLPLSKNELHALISHNTPATFADPLLETMFHTSLETVFCTNPKHKTLEAIVSVCGRRGDRFLYDMMANVLEDTDAVVDAMTSLWLATLSNNNDIVANPYWTNLLQSKPKDMKWRDWLQHVVPCSATVTAHAFCRHFGLQESSAQTSTLTVDADKLWNSPIVDHQLVMTGLGGHWKSLYDSEVDGLSFLPLQNALLGFSGPTMLLVETTDKDVLGYYTSTPWKETNKWFHGEGDSCLFRLAPHWSVYRRQQQHDTAVPFHQYLSHTGKHLSGLAVGGIAEFTPRFHLTLDLDERCKACAVGSVFDNGELLTADTSFFTPAKIQIWALADDAFEQHQARGKQTIEQRERARLRLAKVDRREFLDHFVLDSKVFGHRNKVQGRVDEEVLAASKKRVGT